MTDPIIKEARERLLNSKRWGKHPENAIVSGQWDSGSLIQEQVKEILRDRAEAEGE